MISWLKDIFKSFLQGKTISQVEEDYKDLIEEDYKVEENKPKQGFIGSLLSKYYPIWLIIMILIMLAAITSKYWSKFIFKNIRPYILDVSSRWSWWGFSIFVIFGSLLGYIWGWRMLHLDIEVKQLFNITQDVLPAWAFFKHTVMLGDKMVLGFSYEDLFFYPVGNAFAYLMYKCIGVDNLLKDFKFEIKIKGNIIFLLSLITFSMWAHAFVDFGGRIMVECFVPLGVMLYFLCLNYINFKRFLIFQLWVIFMVFLWDFTSVTLFKKLADVFNLPFDHLSMWFYGIKSTSGNISSVLWKKDVWAWFFKREPFSILVTFPLVTSVWSVGLIAFIENLGDFICVQKRRGRGLKD